MGSRPGNNRAARGSNQPTAPRSSAAAGVDPKPNLVASTGRPSTSASGTKGGETPAARANGGGSKNIPGSPQKPSPDPGSASTQGLTKEATGAIVNLQSALRESQSSPGEGAKMARLVAAAASVTKAAGSTQVATTQATGVSLSAQTLNRTETGKSDHQHAECAPDTSRGPEGQPKTSLNSQKVSGHAVATSKVATPPQTPPGPLAGKREESDHNGHLTVPAGDDGAPASDPVTSAEEATSPQTLSRSPQAGIAQAAAPEPASPARREEGPTTRTKPDAASAGAADSSLPNPPRSPQASNAQTIAPTPASSARREGGSTTYQTETIPGAAGPGTANLCPPSPPRTPTPSPPTNKGLEAPGPQRSYTLPTPRSLPAEDDAARVAFQRRLETPESSLAAAAARTGERTTQAPIAALETIIQARFAELDTILELRLKALETAMPWADAREGVLQRLGDMENELARAARRESRLQDRVKVLERKVALLEASAIPSAPSGNKDEDEEEEEQETGREGPGLGIAPVTVPSPSPPGQDAVPGGGGDNGPVEPTEDPGTGRNHPLVMGRGGPLVSECETSDGGGADLGGNNVDGGDDGNGERRRDGGDSGEGEEASFGDLQDGLLADTEMPDGELGRAFLELETHIRALVMDHFRFGVDEDTAAKVAVKRWNANAFPSEAWGNAKLKKSTWFHRLVANLLHAELFAAPFFGCQETSVEKGLVGFEQLVLGQGEYPGHQEDLAWWRALTMKIIGGLSPPSQPERRDPDTCQRLAEVIKTEFSPIFKLSKKADKKLLQVCRKAVECATATRKSRSTYLWEQTRLVVEVDGKEFGIIGARLGEKDTLGANQVYEVVFSVSGPVVKEYEVAERGEIVRGRTNILRGLAVVK
ncbi:hypothetical protein B0H63DRAFT_74656 [Podospora didyma]|uniref:Uncharacterized protein n=1 Tax=Podospora didyma TaxID=330526 RepID=A0AAE0K1G5_9PEZI|nr:hypothetical protein B0H63DRAFT_74656 [Podospora didyma]